MRANTCNMHMHSIWFVVRWDVAACFCFWLLTWLAAAFQVWFGLWPFSRFQGFFKTSLGTCSSYMEIYQILFLVWGKLLIQLYSQITQFCSNKWSLTWKDELVCFSPRCISKLSSVGILYCKIIEHTDATSLNRVVLFVYIGRFCTVLIVSSVA